MLRPLSLRVDRNGKGLVYAESINVETRDGDAGEQFDLVQDAWTPFSQAVLDKAELGQLLLPFGILAKGLDVAILDFVRKRRI